MLTALLKDLINNLNDNALAYGVVCALSAWLGQVLASRIARREDSVIQERVTKLQADLETTQSRLAARIEKSVHVHKVQFEKEFVIYQDMMRKASLFHLAFFTLHRALQPVHDKEDDAEAYYKPLRENVFESVESLRETIRENRPFYAREVFSDCNKLLDLAIEDVASLKTSPGTGFLTFKEMEKLKKDVDAALDTVVTSIRERLNSLIVVE